MTVIHRMDHRQTTAVVAVGISAQLVLDHVALEIGDLAHFQDSSFCYGGCPFQA